MADNNDDLVIPVIWGLSLGIVFVVIFSVAAKPSFNMSDEEIRVKLMTVPEVQAFYEKAFHETIQPTEEIRHEGTATYVEYQIDRTWSFDDGNPTTPQDYDITTKVLRLTVRVDSFGKTAMTLECAGPMSTSWTPTVSDIKTTTCLENP